MRTLATMPEPKRSKYGVDQSDAGKLRRTYKNKVYPSVAERNRAEFLDMLMGLGEVLAVQEQPRYPLHSSTGAVICTYVADFLVTEKDGSQRVEEVKSSGTVTDLFLLKRKWYEDEDAGPPIVVLQWKRGAWQRMEDVKRARKPSARSKKAS